MDNGTNTNLTSSIGFMGALQLLLIGLKLGRVIDWSWWKVLLPLEVDLGLLAVGVLGVVALAVRDSKKA